MKKAIVSLLLLSTVLSAVSCKKSKKEDKQQSAPYTCASCVSSPEALAANDASGKGVYKGIIVGSTGTIKFAVQNGNNDITATMEIDGTTVTLTSSISWVSGQPYVAPFTGQLNGQAVSITFSVQPDGSNPVITSANIPGHPNAVFTLVKETSNALIECYEGTYSTTRPETGTFDIVLSRAIGKWGGKARQDGQSGSEDVSGTLSNGVLTDDKGHQVGTLSGDNISGTSKDSDGNTVTISGKRTL